jgi:hypothetical protein
MDHVQIGQQVLDRPAPCRDRLLTLGIPASHALVIA